MAVRQFPSVMTKWYLGALSRSGHTNRHAAVSSGGWCVTCDGIVDRCPYPLALVRRFLVYWHSRCGLEPISLLKKYTISFENVVEDVLEDRASDSDWYQH